VSFEIDRQLSWLPFAIDLSVTPPVMHSRPSIASGAVVARLYARGRVSLRDASAPPRLSSRHD